jgi:hypothetical protein
MWDGSGWLWIRKHTRFVHGVFYDLGSWSTGQADVSTLNPPEASSMIETTGEVSGGVWITKIM